MDDGKIDRCGKTPFAGRDISVGRPRTKREAIKRLAQIIALAAAIMATYASLPDK